MRPDARIQTKLDRIRRHRDRVERDRKRLKEDKNLIETWKWHRLRELQKEGRLGPHATISDIKDLPSYLDN